MSRHHVAADKVGLIVNAVREWPASREWLKDDDGNKFPTLHDAVAALVAIPTPYVPMGCPTPDPETGRCPGHPS